MPNNDYNRYCENDNCNNQLLASVLSTRKYCNSCQIERKKLQLAVIVKNRRQRIKEEKMILLC